MSETVDLGGRPKANLEEALTKTEEFLKLGYSFYKACQLAQIPYSTYEPYYMDDEGFRRKVDGLRSQVCVIARKNIISQIEEKKSIGDSWAWLQSQEKDEFSTKSIVDTNDPERGKALNQLRDIVNSFGKQLKENVNARRNTGSTQTS